MQDVSTDQVMAAVSRSALIAAVEEAAHELVGMRILFMLRQHDDIVKLSPDGSESALPAFCSILRGSHAGMRKCSACRALVGFGACYRGLTEYSCHGGVHVVAAAALDGSGRASRSVVVSSSAFAAEDRDAGWAAVLAHAEGEHVDKRRLRKAYGALPLLTATNLSIAKALVQIAAAAVGEIEHSLVAAVAATAAGKDSGSTVEGPGIQERLTAALFVARDLPHGSNQAHRGDVLAELVKDLVSRDPGMPFTVARIATAAHLTPNHFSMLFRKHTGETFQQFLTERRIAHAKLLLRDLSLNIADIAHRVGFTDAGYFARRFKERSGVTPRQWRDAL